MNSRIRRGAILLGALLVTYAALATGAQGYVYWANGLADTIGRANLDGSGVNPEFITETSSPCGVAVDAAHIYWANEADGTIGRANLDGSGVNPRFIAGSGFACGVAVDAGHIYWTDAGFDRISRANLNGTGVDRNFITGGELPDGVAVNGAHVYWANSGFGDVGTIGRANLNGTGANQSFFPGLDSPLGPSVNATHVFWANNGTNSIGRANLNGSGVNRRLITGAKAPTSTAVDAGHVYWTNFNGDSVGRANLDGSGVDQNFITKAAAPVGVAVDALGQNEFSFGKVKRNKRKGTAKLTVNVPRPGGLQLAKTKKVKGAEKSATAAGSVKLPVKPKGKAKRKLGKRGKAKVKAVVTYSPQGGPPSTKSKRVKLKRRPLSPMRVGLGPESGEAEDAVSDGVAHLRRRASTHHLTVSGHGDEVAALDRVTRGDDSRRDRGRGARLGDLASHRTDRRDRRPGGPLHPDACFVLAELVVLRAGALEGERARDSQVHDRVHEGIPRRGVVDDPSDRGVYLARGGEGARVLAVQLVGVGGDVCDPGGLRRVGGAGAVRAVGVRDRQARRELVYLLLRDPLHLPLVDRARRPGRIRDGRAG